MENLNESLLDKGLLALENEEYSSYLRTLPDANPEIIDNIIGYIHFTKYTLSKSDDERRHIYQSLRKISIKGGKERLTSIMTILNDAKIRSVLEQQLPSLYALAEETEEYVHEWEESTKSRTETFLRKWCLYPLILELEDLGFIQARRIDLIYGLLIKLDPNEFGSKSESSARGVIRTMDNEARRWHKKGRPISGSSQTKE